MPISELVAKLLQGSLGEMLDAADAIGRRGAVAVHAVAPFLHADDRETRWRAAIALERIGGPAVGALETAASDDRSTICTPALWALARIGDARAVGTLISVMNDGVEPCRWMAAAALLWIGTERERAMVEAAFQDDPEGRAIVEELLEGS